MKILRKQLEKEGNELRKIAYFDPRFIEIYGNIGRSILALFCISIFIASSYWIYPEFLNSNTREILFGLIILALVAFGAFVVGNVIGEYFIKGYGVIAIWLKKELKLSLEAKIVGFLSLSLFALSVVVYFFVKDGDIWAYPILGIAVTCSYFFVKYAWNIWYENKAQQVDSGDADTPLA